jgi:hypothetical protein
VESCRFLVADCAAAKFTPPLLAVTDRIRPHPACASQGSNAAFSIVEVQITADRGARLGDAVVGLQICLLVFDRFPQPLDKYVVAPRTLAVHAMEEPALRSGGSVRCRDFGAGRGFEVAARQDRGADAGERFFVRSARRGRHAERKAMINRSHDLPIVRQAELLNVSRGSVYYEPQPASAEDPAIMLAADLNRMSSESLSVERGLLTMLR